MNEMEFRCVLCEGDSAELVSNKDAKSGDILPVYFCISCGLVQQSPMPDEEVLKIYYSHHYRLDYKATYTPKKKHIVRAGIAAKNRLDMLRNAGISSGNLVDIGAGGGEFVYLSRRYGFNSKGLEPNQGYSEYARQEYRVEISTCGIEDLQKHSCDVITMFHVLEHIRSPKAVVEALNQALADDGYVLIEVPNVEAKDNSPHNIFFKAHLIYYSLSSLNSFFSEYFTPIFSENTGNITVIYKKTHSAFKLPSSNQIDFTRERIKSKGWLEYLTVGGGAMKPLKKLIGNFHVMKVKGLSGKEILDSIEL